MTVHIENDRPELDFAMVPNRLITDRTLTALARMTLIYMCSMPRGYILHVHKLRDDLGLGVHAWRRVSAELKDRGALKVWPRRDRKTGQVLGTTHRVSWSPWLASTESRKTAHSVEAVDKPPRVGKPDSRVSDPLRDLNPTHKGSKSDSLIREREKNARGRARKSGASAAGRKDAAGRRDATPEAAPRGATEIGRVLPSIERRREIAQELGIDPDGADLWRLDGDHVGEVP